MASLTFLFPVKKWEKFAGEDKMIKTCARYQPGTSTAEEACNYYRDKEFCGDDPKYYCRYCDTDLCNNEPE
jgi:hypothetical protein